MPGFRQLASNFLVMCNRNEFVLIYVCTELARESGGFLSDLVIVSNVT